MKECPDCGASSPDMSVTCQECGSLFADQIGIEIRRRPENVEPIEIAGLSTAGGAPQPSSAVSVCRVCGATGPASHQRCAVCGSDDVVLQLAASTTAARKSKRYLSAWDRRPRVGVLDVGAPDVSIPFAYTYFAIGVFKLLLGSLLGATMLFGRVGPSGLQYTTYVWRFPLAAVLFLDAFSGALGGYGLLNVKRYGAILLAVSFLLDITLIAWMVTNMMSGRIVVWPDPGPYIFLGFICLYCCFETTGKAVTGNLK